MLRKSDKILPQTDRIFAAKPKVRQAACLLLCAPVMIFSETERTAPVLPPMVVTSGREAESVARVARRVETRDALDLQLGRMPRTVPEAFREMPSVMIQKTGHGQGSPYLRGWTGFRTLMLVDGVRLNNSTFRDGPNQYWSTIDSLGTERLELVLGPGSVMYGSDAVGGTAQVFTPDPLARSMAGEQGRVYLRGASAERALFGRVEAVAPAGADAAAQAGISYKVHGDLRSGSGRQPNTGFAEWGADAKVSGFTGTGGRWTLLYQEYQMEGAPRTHRTRDAVPFRGTEAGTDLQLDLDQARRLFAAAWEQPETQGAFRDVQARISWHRQEEFQERVRANGRRDESEFRVHTPGLTLQGALGEPGRTWIVGTDVYYDRVSSSGQIFQPGAETPERQIQGPVGDEATYWTTGAFVRHVRALHERLDLDAGVRGAYSRAEVGRYENPQTGEADALSGDWSALVGSLHLRYALSEVWQVHGGVSQGFRAPNLSDLTRLGVARSGEVELPTPDLDPERFLHYEVGLRRHQGAVTGELTLWYTDADDLISRKPTGAFLDGEPTVTKTNAASGHLWGVEAGLDWRPAPRWNLWTRISWQDGSVDSFLTSEPASTREPFSRLMPLTAHIGVRHWVRETLWVEGVMTHAEKADKLSAGDMRDTQRIPPGGTPGYTVAHLRSGWQIDPSLHISLAVENLLDEDYRVHGSGLNEPGRNVVLAMDKRF